MSDIPGLDKAQWYYDNMEPDDNEDEPEPPDNYAQEREDRLEDA